MELLCVILILSATGLTQGLINSACTWWDRYHQRRSQALQVSQEQERSKLHVRKITKTESPSLFCHEIQRIATYCNTMDPNLRPKKFQCLELFHTWDKPLETKSVQMFVVPSSGTKICLVPNHLWVTLSGLDGFHVSGLLFEGDTNQIVDWYLQQ
jgi:hypothetical protein